MSGQGTANEIAKAYLDAHPDEKICSESIRKRAHELVLRGLIRIVDSRACEVTGSRCSVYERRPASDEGSDA